MAEVELAEDTLIVHVRGMDQLWALRSGLEVPLSHVVGAQADPQEAQGWWRGIRTGGTQRPGVITAGTFHQEGERVFWDVRNPQKTVVIKLKDERYARLVIEVDDPQATVAAIEGALGEWRNRRACSHTNSFIRTPSLSRTSENAYSPQ